MSRTVCNRTSAAFLLVPLGLRSKSVVVSFEVLLKVALSGLSAKRAAHDFTETTKGGRNVRAEMHAEEPPSALGQHFKVALGLKPLEHPEGVFLAGDRKILRVLGSDL